MAENEEERPTENDLAQAIRQMAREATVDTTRQMVAPVVVQINEQVQSIGQKVQHLDQVGHSAEKSFAQIWKMVQDLQKGFNSLVQQVGDHFGQLRSRIDEVVLRGEQSRTSVLSQVECLTSMVEVVKSESSQRFAYLEGQIIAVGAMHLDRDPPAHQMPSPQCITKGDWQNTETRVTHLLERVLGLESQIKKASEMAGQIPGVLQELDEMQESSKEWHAWMTLSVGGLQTEVSKALDEISAVGGGGGGSSILHLG